MPIVLSENFRALFYAPFYAAHATGAFAEAGVEVDAGALAEPAEAAAKALRAGEVDVMWGGPLRVMMIRDRRARRRPGLLLRRRGARSVLHHRRASPSPTFASPTSRA